jgi:hypothetical protein
MRNLANIEASIANMLARVELLKADVFTFEVMRIAKTEMQCNIIGLREYKNKQGAIFVRQPDHWLVSLRNPIPIVTGLDAGIRFEKPDSIATFTCIAEVSTQEGLECLVRYLDKISGEQLDLSVKAYPRVDSTDLCQHFTWFDSRELLFLPIVYEKHSRGKENVLGRLLVTGLRNLGRARGSAREIEECEIEAADIAWRDIDIGGPEHIRIQSSLASQMKYQMRLLQHLLDETRQDEEGRLKVVQELEWTQIKLIHWLWRLDRKKEAESVGKKIAMLRLELIQYYSARRIELEQQNTESWDRIVELSLVCRRFARLCARMEQYSAASQLMAEAEQYRQMLPEAFQAKLGAELACDSKLPPPWHASGQGHQFGHYDWTGGK